MAKLGFSPTFASQVSPSAAEFPAINMSSLYSLGDTGDWDYYDEASHNFSVVVDKFVGRHSLREASTIVGLATSGAGDQLHHGAATRSIRTVRWERATAGRTLADLLLGLPYNRQADTASTLTDVIPYYGASPRTISG